MGSIGTSNATGDVQKKLDVFANEQFISSLNTGGECCGIASEENEDIIAFDNPVSRNAKYVVAIDPLDGSSNIDVNVSIGTIFSIYRRITFSGECLQEDFLQKGTKQVAAGYVIYGSSTMLVYTTGNGVNGFTLDPSIGEFCLSHPSIKMPENGTVYSINQGYFLKFPQSIKDYITYCQSEDKATNRPYSLRYIGSMVADFHRNLINGGVFLYPSTKSAPNGKLRLLYECNPMSFIAEQAGGKAINGNRRILELEPTELHQRTPIFLGSKDMVEKVEDFINTTVSVAQ